ncbi:crotonase/enoyl-CoA hydratase family protein [Stenotrophobium rhamnosiphilum]|uniref:Enoyl-CoA hydratase n=1 Tax=Stenotrophobium rhamnosiphilum TaxID=2029166 RepID=A0A2T5ME72_9GAMM|nr:crotonase/enoyl-CoA hydratase family protein [Stenotrophobium rhamnosiphilum]PTU30881.1 enoyl-CoA hydratase [Stenotrophobium rhamnosiphilum]
MSNKVITERRGHLLLIGLNRADKLNALDPEMITQLSNAYTLLDRDRELRCGVLWADGRYFTSGLDLAKVIKAAPREILTPMIPRGGIDPWGTNGNVCRKPIVSAVEGPCYTAGIELLLNAQITVASDNARFTQAEISRGVFPFGGGTVRWPLAVGTQNAYLHLLMADEFDADEAYRIGLVQKRVKPGEALNAAIAIAERISQQAPLGVQATLQSVRHMQTHGAQSALSKLKMKFVRLLLSKDARRGVEAFKARRTATFEGN